jgi:hypothetical protein
MITYKLEADAEQGGFWIQYYCNGVWIDERCNEVAQNPTDEAEAHLIAQSMLSQYKGV